MATSRAKTPIARETVNPFQDAKLKQSGKFLCMIVVPREAVINSASNINGRQHALIDLAHNNNIIIITLHNSKLQ